jgi:hypothetical protein
MLAGCGHRHLDSSLLNHYALKVHRFEASPPSWGLKANANEIREFSLYPHIRAD